MSPRMKIESGEGPSSNENGPGWDWSGACVRGLGAADRKLSLTGEGADADIAAANSR